MDAQNEKAAFQKPLTHEFVIENYDLRDTLPSRKFLVNFHDKGVHNRRIVGNLASTYDNVDKIINKYKNENTNKTNYQYSNINLNRNLAEQTRNIENLEFAHSVQNISSDCDGPKYMTNSIKTGISKRNCESIKSKYLLSGNHVPKLTFREHNYSNNTNMDNATKNCLTSKETLYADKATYCRPVLSLYNEQFIYKTMERNSKLKRLVKKLALTRQRERENVCWNNFINDLKNKHGLTCEDSHRTLQSQHEPDQNVTSDIIDDYYNTKFSWQKSRLCRNLLQDFYDASQPTCSNRRTHDNGKSQLHSNLTTSPYHTDSYCYPTSSHGRLIVLERERLRNRNLSQWPRLSNNTLKFNKNYIKKNSDIHFAEKENSKDRYLFNSTNNKLLSKACFKSAMIQTDATFFTSFKENIYKSKATNNIDTFRKDDLVQTFKNENNNREIKQDIASIIKNISLMNIENKLEILINSVNRFIEEVQSNRKPKHRIRCASVTCEMNKDTDKKINTTRSDIVGTAGVARIEKIEHNIRNHSFESIIPVSNICPNILQKPQKINNFNSKDMLFNKNQACSVQITFEIPTKDCSTEVTQSLSKQDYKGKVELIEEISTPHYTPVQKMTIAVNTDPLSFLSLLRISTEALKHLLSYMPNIDYCSYLSMLHFPQPTRNVETHYICNICGAAFNKPSKLSDHIEEHNLGRTRECCVCRHVLNVCRRSPSLFKCRFCGQRFTRAYCCELHQQCCAKRLGQKHDVSSSLILLK